MELYSLNPFIRYASVHLRHIVWQRNSVCYDCRLFYIKEGEGELTVNNEKTEFGADTAVFLPPGSVYRIDFTNDKKMEMVVINFDLTDEYSEYRESMKTANEENFDERKVKLCRCDEVFRSPMIVPDCGAVSESLAACAEKFLVKDMFYREKSSALLKLCLIKMIQKNGQSSASNNTVDSVRSYIHKNYGDPELTNITVAKRFNYHPYYISAMFKSATGMTLHKYIVNYRIKMAQNMLVTTDLDVGQIALETGFSSSSHFTKTFSAVCHVTPTKYKATHILSDI